MYDDALFSHILAVSNRTLSKRPFLEQIEEICKHHPKGLILREKYLSEAEYTALAKDVLAICQRHNVSCILHTYFRAAKELDCNAIHLPLPLLRAHKEELSSFSHVGTSIHAPAEAEEAEKLYLCHRLQKRTSSQRTCFSGRSLPQGIHSCLCHWRHQNQ